MEDSILYLEKIRTKAAILLSLILIVSALVIVSSFSVFASQDIVDMGFFLSISLGVGIGFLLGKVTGFFKISNEYKTCFKATFVEIPLRDTFTNVIYDGKKGFDEEIIRNTELMSMGNCYYSNDYVQGYYKDVKFERADVKIQQTHSNGKTTYTVTHLHGRWLIFEFNKDFHYDMQIIGNGFPSSRKKNTIFTEAEERRHRIKLEDIEFNELFKVFCQDEHEAYYILTPQFMSVLKDMSKDMDGSIMLGFVDNQLHIIIHNEKDAMEPKIFEKIDLASVKEEVQKEIKVITNIIDSLKLDRDFI